MDAFSDVAILLISGERGVKLLRWGTICDILGYYLLIVTRIRFLRRWLHPLDPYRMGLYTICLLAYSLIRASGAAITSAVMPPMIEADMS